MPFRLQFYELDSDVLLGVSVCVTAARALQVCIHRAKFVRMTERVTRWYRRLVALAELHGHHTQQEIAEALNVSPAAVSGWRHGRPPRAETVVNAALLYKADPGELLKLVFVDDVELPKERPRTPREPLR